MLHEAPEVDLVAIFGPEHGFRSASQVRELRFLSITLRLTQSFAFYTCLVMQMYRRPLHSLKNLHWSSESANSKLSDIRLSIVDFGNPMVHLSYCLQYISCRAFDSHVT